MAWQALLGMGLNFASGRMAANEQKRADKKNMWMWQQEMKQAQHQFDQQMDMSVTRRVRDAVNAGVHPLFALGASVGASPTIASGGAPYKSGNSPMANALAQMGQSVMQLNTSQAKLDESQAAYYDSMAALNAQKLAGEGRDTLGTSGSNVITHPYNPEVYAGQVEVLPAQVISGKKGNVGQEAGDGPMKRTRTESDGQVVELYSSDSQMDEVNQGYVLAQRAKWHAQWKVWDMYRGTGKRAYQAKKYILSNTAPEYRKQVQQKLRASQERGTPRFGIYPKSWENWQQYRRNGGTLSWRQWKKEGN